MCSFYRRDLKPHYSPWRARARKLLRVLAFGAVALVAAGFSTGAITAATDPNWIGTAPINISHSETRKTLHPAIGVGPSAQIVVAWNDLPPGESKPDIYVTQSADGGKNWYPSSRVLDTDAKSQLPDVAVARGKVFIAWTEERSHSDGTTTLTVHETDLEGNSRSIQTETGTASGIPTAPRLAASPDRLHVVFNAGEKFSHIFHASRALADTAWPPAERIHSTTDSMAWFPTLAVSPDGEDLHVVWEELSVSGRSVWYMYGAAAGSHVSWTDPRRLSRDATSVKPDVAVSSDGNVHVVWGEADTRGGSYFVRYCRYHPTGESCSQSKRVDPRPVYVNEISPTESSPRLALWEDSDRVRLCVAWHGFREGESAEDTLVSCSEDGGDTWQPPRTMSPLPEEVPESADISIWPSVVFDAAGNLHGVWQQRVDIISAQSDYEIYYAHAINCVFLPLVIRNG